jgi:hypothetical protein
MNEDYISWSVIRPVGCSGAAGERLLSGLGTAKSFHLCLQLA